MDWEVIVRDNAPGMLRIATRILRRAADAEDAVQDAFVKAYEADKRSPVRDWGAFLNRLTVNGALDRLRMRKDALPVDEAGISDGKTSDPLTILASRELAERLRREVAWLPRQQAEVFCLRYFDDKSNAEIATMLDIQPGAVATVLHKARKRLAAALEQFQEIGNAESPR